jgi:hypothetical protein
VFSTLAWLPSPLVALAMCWGAPFQHPLFARVNSKTSCCCIIHSLPRTPIPLDVFLDACFLASFVPLLDLINPHSTLRTSSSLTHGHFTALYNPCCIVTNSSRYLTHLMIPLLFPLPLSSPLHPHPLRALRFFCPPTLPYPGLFYLSVSLSRISLR